MEKSSNSDIRLFASRPLRQGLVSILIQPSKDVRDLEKRELTASSIRRKLSALSALFDYLCEPNAVSGNRVDGVKRPMATGQ